MNSEVVLFLRSIFMYRIGIGTETAVLNSQAAPISQVVLKTGFTVHNKSVLITNTLLFNMGWSWKWDLGVSPQKSGSRVPRAAGFTKTLVVSDLLPAHACPRDSGSWWWPAGMDQAPWYHAGTEPIGTLWLTCYGKTTRIFKVRMLFKSELVIWGLTSLWHYFGLIATGTRFIKLDGLTYEQIHVCRCLCVCTGPALY